jgi:hypothetical protein
MHWIGGEYIAQGYSPKREIAYTIAKQNKNNQKEKKIFLKQFVLQLPTSHIKS